MLAPLALAASTLLSAACDDSAQPAAAQPQPTAPAPGAPRPAAPPLDWRSLEAPLLRRHIQVTSRDRFVKAGEAYFSPDSTWIIFQAVAVPKEGQEPDPFYAMYVARLKRDNAGRITGTEEPIKVSPPGSANTCGWFHPTQPWRILFGSTLTPPSSKQRSGFSVQGRKYVWMFPEEMEIVTRSFPPAIPPPDADAPPREAWVPATPLFTRPNYDAECSYSKDGRFVLYAHVRDEPTHGRPDADIFVYDTKTKQHYPLVVADGYDGGPFFSPDEKHICYRSDRKGDDLLQLFIAELDSDADGVPVGIKREHQLTDDSNVNWAPFWHPSGRFLVFGTSAQGHTNYEVYSVQADPSVMDTPAVEVPKRRVTFADGADVLPAFSPDGRLFMWTAQRGPLAAGGGETRPSSQLWIAECTPGGFDSPGTLFQGEHNDGLNIIDVQEIAKAELREHKEEWADRARFFVERIEGGGWWVRAQHPSRKKGEDRIMTIDRAANVTSYQAY